MSTPTTPRDLKRINQMVDNICNDMDYLAARWSNEGSYESIDEYAKVLKGKLPKGFTLLKMTKRPFGFRFSIGTGAIYFVGANSKEIYWKRIA